MSGALEFTINLHICGLLGSSLQGRLTRLEAHFADEESKAQSTDCPEPQSPELPQTGVHLSPLPPESAARRCWHTFSLNSARPACSAAVPWPENRAWGLAGLGAPEGIWGWGRGSLQGSQPCGTFWWEPVLVPEACQDLGWNLVVRSPPELSKPGGNSGKVT